MPYKYELTWSEHTRGWKKEYKGKAHYLRTPCNGQRDRTGYLAAVREWERCRAWLDGLGHCPYAGAGRHRVLIPEDQMPPTRPTYFEIAVSSTAAVVATLPVTPAVSDCDGGGDPPWIESRGIFPFLHPELIAPPQVEAAPQRERLISVLIDRFLQRREGRAKAGKLTLASLDEDTRQLTIFRDWLRVNYVSARINWRTSNKWPCS